MPGRALHVVITGDPRPFQAALAKAGASSSQFATKQKSTTAKVAATGSALSKGLTLPLLAAGAASVKFAADFEQQMSSLAAVTDAPKRAMGELRDEALKAGADTAFSAREAAIAQTELAKGGVSVADILKGALGGALSLAAAGELELGEAAEITANALNLFKLRGSEAGSVADAFATAANATTADVSDFGMALKQSGSVARSAGLSFTETMTALEALAASGIKNSDAGTSLKTALIQLIKPTEKQRNLTDELGLNFLTAGGEMKSLSDISSMLRGKLGGMTKAQRTATLATLAGSDGVRTLTSLYDAGPKQLEKWAKGLGKAGTAQDTAARKQDNFKGKLEQLKGSLETLAIIVGSTLLPPLTALTAKLTNFANSVAKSFANLPKGTQQLILGIAGVLAIIGPLLVVGAKLVSSFSALSGVVTGLAGALGIATAPFLLIAAAIAAVGIAFYLAYTKSAGFRKAVNEIGGPLLASLKGAFRDILPSIKQLGADLQRLGVAVLPVLKAAFQAWAAVVRRAIPGIVTALKGFVQIVRGIVQVITGILTGDFGKAWQGVKNIFSGALKVIVGLVRAATAPMRSALAAIGRVVGSVLGGAWRAVRGVILGVVNAIIGFVRGLARVIANVVAAILRHFANLFDLAGRLPFVGNKFDGLADKARSLADDVDQVGEAADSSIGDISGLGASLSQVAAEFDRATRAAHSFRQTAGGGVGGAGNRRGPGAQTSSVHARAAAMFATEEQIATVQQELADLQDLFASQDATEQLRGAKREAASGRRKGEKRADFKQRHREAKRALADLREELARTKKLEAIQVRIEGLEKIKAFEDAIKGLRSTMGDLAQQAGQKFRDILEHNIEAGLLQAKFAIQNSPLGQELGALLGQRATLERQDLETAVTTAQANLARAQRSGSQRLIDAANRELLDAQIALDQARYDEQIGAAEREAELQTGVLDVQQQIAEQGYASQLQAQVDALEARKQNYQQFADAVNAILAGVGITFEGSPDEEGAIEPSPRGGTHRPRRRRPRHRAGGGQVLRMLGEFTRLNEVGREGVFLPGGSRVVPASRSDNPGEPGYGGTGGFRDLHVHGIPGLTVKDADAIGERVAHKVAARRPR